MLCEYRPRWLLGFSSYALLVLLKVHTRECGKRRTSFCLSLILEFSTREGRDPCSKEEQQQ